MTSHSPTDIPVRAAAVQGAVFSRLKQKKKTYLHAFVINTYLSFYLL